MLILDEWHQEHVVFAPDGEDALAGIAVGVRVLQDVEQSPRSKWKITSSKPMPRSFLSVAFLASSQAKYIATGRIA